MMMKKKSTRRKICKNAFRNLNPVKVLQINLQDYVLSIVECAEGTVFNNVAVTYHKIATYFEEIKNI
jgi:hypothetical protein